MNSQNDRRDVILDALNRTTTRISDRTWTVATGVIATCLAFVIEAGKPQGDPFLPTASIAVPAAIALLAVVFDLLQYLAGYIVELRALKAFEVERYKAEGKQPAAGPIFDNTSFYFGARHACFVLKILLVLLSAAWLLFLITGRVFGF